MTIFTGNAALDSQDITPANKGAGVQRGAVHEFGHLLGLRDEYRGASGGSKHWLADGQSVMHSGEKVRDRHYAMLADWITQQYATAARLARQPIEYKVAGAVDLSNAHL